MHQVSPLVLFSILVLPPFSFSGSPLCLSKSFWESPGLAPTLPMEQALSSLCSPLITPFRPLVSVPFAHCWCGLWADFPVEPAHCASLLNTLLSLSQLSSPSALTHHLSPRPRLDCYENERVWVVKCSHIDASQGYSTAVADTTPNLCVMRVVDYFFGSKGSEAGCEEEEWHCLSWKWPCSSP